jgi:hypothetical protein
MTWGYDVFWIDQLVCVFELYIHLFLSVAVVSLYAYVALLSLNSRHYNITSLKSVHHRTFIIFFPPPSPFFFFLLFSPLTTLMNQISALEQLVFMVEQSNAQLSNKVRKLLSLSLPHYFKSRL